MQRSNGNLIGTPSSAAASMSRWASQPAQVRANFQAYVEGPARTEHDRIIDEAEALGVFGVPTMVFNGELFWGGDRIDMLIERIQKPEGIAAALGSRHRKPE